MTGKPAPRLTTVIAAGFSAVVILMIALVVVVYSHMSKLNGQIDAIFHEHAVKQELATRMHLLGQQRTLKLYEMFLQDDAFAVDELHMEMLSLGSQFGKSRRQLREMALTTAELALYTEQGALVEIIEPTQEKVVDQLLAGARGEARRLLLEEMIPMQSKIYASFSRLVSEEKGRSGNSVAEANWTGERAHYLVLVLAVAACMIGAAIGYVVLRRTAAQSRRIQSSVAELRASRNLLETRVRERTAELATARERLQGLIDSSPAVIYTANAKAPFECTFASENIARLLDAEPAELVNKEHACAHAGLVHPKDAPAARAAWSEHLALGGGAMDYRLRRRDGRYVWVHDVHHVVCDEHGQATEVVGAWTDVTERRVIEDATQRMVRAVSSNMGDDFFHSLVRYLVDALDVDSALVGELEGSGNERVCTISVCADGEIQPNFQYDLADTPCEHVVCQQLCLYPNNVQARFPRDPMLVEMGMEGYAGTPLFDSSNQPVGILVVLSRTSIPNEGLCRHILQLCALRAQSELERRRLDRQLLKARDAAIRAAGAKSEFLATMSHEIRTPMNGITGMLDLLQETSLKSAQWDYVKTARCSADALLTVINDILDFSKIEAGKLDLEVIDFDLRDLAEQVSTLFAEAACVKGIELACLLPTQLPNRLRGDPTRLRQVLSNLLSNAIKFTNQGEVVLKVLLERETDATVQLRFEVQDTGIGIELEAQRTMFEPFSQADSSTTRRFGGTGLGLAICHQLVSLMGGTVQVHSEPGNGTLFSFVLCLEQSTQPSSVPQVRDDLQGLRALVVDDNRTNCQVLEYYLNSWGLVYASAADGQAALETLSTASAAGEPFDLAILDMQMPGMDGMQLSRCIAERPALRGLCRIMLSSQGQPEYGFAASGIAAWLHKPVRQSQLFDTLTTAMGADSQAVHRPAEPFPGEGDFDPTRVLLVEDNEVNCKVALNMLCKLGISVELVHDGLAAVQATARERFAAVLMDCQMPVMDGYEATAAIRERERADGSTRLPIVAMTANAMKGDHERCISAGMDDYISKPFKRDGLETVLRKWLSSNTRSNAVVETTTNASAPGRDPLDRPTIEELRDLLEEEFDELIETYIEDAPSRIEKLASAAQVGDTEAVYQCAHSLKSSSANVGALELSAIARNLEELSRSGTVPGSDLLEQAQQEARQVLDALENLTSGRSAA